MRQCKVTFDINQTFLVTFFKWSQHEFKCHTVTVFNNFFYSNIICILYMISNMASVYI